MHTFKDETVYIYMAALFGGPTAKAHQRKKK